MRLFFGGGEAPALRAQLIDADVTKIMVNWAHQYARQHALNIGAAFPHHVDVLLYSGIDTALRNPDARDDWEQFAGSYFQNVERNLDRLSYAVDFPVGDADTIEHMRSEFWDSLPYEKWCAYWTPAQTLEEVIAGRRKRIGIPSAALRTFGDDLLKEIKGYQSEGIKFTLFGAMDWDVASKFDHVVTTTWTAPARYGETLVWTGRKMKRIPVSEKEKGRRKAKHFIRSLECDYDKILADDHEEVSKLAIKSLLAWEDRLLPAGVTDRPSVERESGTALSARIASVKPEVGDRHVTESGGRKMLPIMAGLVRTTETGEHPMEVVTSDSQLRKCDSCALQDMGCPEFIPGNHCAYAIPVEIRTKDQLLSVTNALLEMQTQRVLFARFAEELEGGMPTKEVSREMDRFMLMADKAKQIANDRDFMRVTVETQQGGGVLSQLFGERAGASARELATPLDSDAVIAEIVED